MTKSMGTCRRRCTRSSLLGRPRPAIPKEFVKECMEGKTDARGLLRLVLDYCSDNEEHLANHKFFIEYLRVANCRAGRNEISRKSAPEPLLGDDGRAWVRKTVLSDLPNALDTIPQSVESNPKSS